MTQTELAERWQLGEATLERWRTEAGGSVFLKLGGQVRYRIQDVEALGEEALRGSAKIDGGVDQTTATNRPPFRRPQTGAQPGRPIAIWLRTGLRNTGFRPVCASRQR